MNAQALTIKRLIAVALDQVSVLLREEAALAKTEMSENLRRAAVAVGLLVLAAVLALVALNALADAAVITLIALGMAPVPAGLAVAAFFGLICLVLLRKGLRDLSAAQLAPRRTIDSIKRNTETLTEVRHG